MRSPNINTDVVTNSERRQKARSMMVYSAYWPEFWYNNPSEGTRQMYVVHSYTICIHFLLSMWEDMVKVDHLYVVSTGLDHS